MAQLAKEKGLNMTKEQQIINKIKEWLEDTGEFDERLDDIDIGFIQCQQNLLELIKKWEKQ